MGEVVRFFAAGVPVVKGNLRSSRSGHAYYPNGAKLKAWSADVALEARVAASRARWVFAEKDVPVEVLTKFYMPRPQCHHVAGNLSRPLKDTAPRFPVVRPDEDKLRRAVLDALTGVLYADDSQVVQGSQCKAYVEHSTIQGVSGVFVVVEVVE